MLELEPNLAILIIEITIQMHKQDPTYDSRPIIQYLMKIKRCRSVFQLIAQERKSIIDSEMNIRKG